MKKKLIQINVTANWGSTGKIVEAIGLSAIKEDWESYIAYGSASNKSSSKLLRIGNKANRYFHFLEQRIRDNEGLCSRLETIALIKKIKEINPDIIHLHNLHDHYLNYNLLFEYLNTTDIKIVWTFHDCWAFTGHCMHFVTKNCERWKTMCYDCKMRGEYPKTLFDRCTRNYLLKKRMFSNNRNLTIVTCSNWLKGFVEESFLKDKQILTIHNGIDLETFQPSVQKRSKIDGIFRIIAVSNVWNKEKGLDDILKLRSILSDSYLITIVGLSTDQLKNLPEGIKGIQRTQNARELAGLYSESDVLINPTYADTFPTVNLEALACGTPVVTYRTGGSPEAIDDKTGIVINQGDVTGLANSIIYLNNNPISSKDCRIRAEQLFDKNKCYAAYIKLYNSLIKVSYNEQIS